MRTTKKYGKKIDLALSTWVKLARAYASFSKKSFQNIRSFGLTQAQFAVIETLGHLGQMRVGELCKKMLVTGGNMTLVLDNLEKMGLIRRIDSREDRRAIIIELTPEGKQLFEKIFPEHAQYIANVIASLTTDEQKTLGELLKKLGITVQNLP